MGDTKSNGGPVIAGTPYTVGERGPEVFIPARDGLILPPEPTDEQRARAVKFVSPDTIEGPLFLFGSVDTDGEMFTKDTDFCLEWFGKSGRPILYEHGLDPKLKTAVIGRQIDYELRDEGIWAQGELDRHARYRKGVDQLIERGAIGYSGGAMPHLATKSKSGAITRFPWVEATLTVTPAEPGNLGLYYLKSADALAHLAEVDIDVPAPLKAALAALDEWADNRDTALVSEPLADRLDRVSGELDGLREHAREYTAMRAKSGRVLSSTTRERLLRHPASLRELADDLDDLLSAADAEKATKSADLPALLLDFERTLARLNGVELPAQGATS